MGKKNRDRSDVDRLRDVIRTLKSENRNLKKQLGKTNKKVKAYEEHIDLSVESEIVEDQSMPDSPGCPECGEPVQSVSLGVKILITCTSCKYRKTVKK